MKKQDELDNLCSELEQVEAMTENEVCDRYNTDCKQDIIDAIKGDIESLEEQIKEEEYEDQIDYSLPDPAFTSWAESYGLTFSH